MVYPRSKYFFLLLVTILTFGSLDYGQAQNASKETKAVELLQSAGFEEIRVRQNNEEVLCTIERGLYRSPDADLRKVVQLLQSVFQDEKRFLIILLEQGQPAYRLTWGTGEKQNTSERDSYLAEITWADQDDFKAIKKEPVSRGVRSGISLVLYPQLTLQNMHFKQIYEKQLNVAPALAYSGWKGMLLTAQLIFPLINELNYTGDYIRPGFLAFSQNLNLPKLNQLKFTIGNFNQNRYGIDLRWKKRFRDSRWSLAANMGLTGFSSVYNRYWNHSPLNTISWNGKVSYYVPRYQLQTDLTAGQFLAGDKGARIDVFRHFGEVTIGVYAAYTGYNPNGGFHFALPLDPFKRRHQHRVRVILPAYFDMEYNARNEFVYDRQYEISPDENRSVQDINPQNIHYLFINP